MLSFIDPELAHVYLALRSPALKKGSSILFFFCFFFNACAWRLREARALSTPPRWYKVCSLRSMTSSCYLVQNFQCQGWRDESGDVKIATGLLGIIPIRIYGSRAREHDVMVRSEQALRYLGGVGNARTRTSFLFSTINVRTILQTLYCLLFFESKHSTAQVCEEQCMNSIYICIIYWL